MNQVGGISIRLLKTSPLFTRHFLEEIGDYG